RGKNGCIASCQSIATITPAGDATVSSGPDAGAGCLCAARRTGQNGQRAAGTSLYLHSYELQSEPRGEWYRDLVSELCCQRARQKNCGARKYDVREATFDARTHPTRYV